MTDEIHAGVGGWLADLVQWLGLAVVGLVQWIFHRDREQMRDHRTTCDAHREQIDGRLRSVEQRSATRDDMHQLRADMQVGFGELRTEIRDQMRIISDIIQRGSR